MITLITSCEKNKEYREALRDTWLKDIPHYLFLIGGAEETHIEGDILYVKAGDDYLSVAEKQLVAFQFCSKNYEFDYIFICDDDAYVCADRLMDCDYDSYDYYGGGPVRMWDIPYYVTGGQGVFLSYKSISAILNLGGKHLKSEIYSSVIRLNHKANKKDCFWGDRFIGLTLDEAGIKPTYDNRFVEMTLNPLSDVPKQHNNIISYHISNQKNNSMTPEKIRDIHNHFQTPLKPIRVAMIVDQWSMGGAEKEFVDMILDADPTKIQYVGIAVYSAWEFRVNPKHKHKMPPFHCCCRNYETAIDNDLIKHETFAEAVDAVSKDADVIIKWHINNQYVEAINKPSILISNATSWYTESNYQRIIILYWVISETLLICLLQGIIKFHQKT